MFVSNARAISRKILGTRSITSIPYVIVFSL
jgi:hypothetical protein